MTKKTLGHPDSNRLMPAETHKLSASYPTQVKQGLLNLRQLILEEAAALGLADSLQETLKWGQLSFVAPQGSTVRIGWIDSSPVTYAIFFHCQSKLVDTFRELYPKDFAFQGNRAIVFAHNDIIDPEKIKHCVSLALTYHKRKHLPMLDAHRRR